MSYGWPRTEEYRLLRAADAAIALVVDGHMADECGWFAVMRLLTTMLNACPFNSGDPTGLLDAGYDALTRVESALESAGADEAAVRDLLARALLAAIDDNFGAVDDWMYGHAMWNVFQLTPLARRLRLLAHDLGFTSVGLAAAAGQRPHQLGHWAASRSKPGAPQRAALANALGIHPGWLSADRDDAVDAALYHFAFCPCGDLDLRLGPLDDEEARGSGSGLWCSGCGQPYAVSTCGWFYPVPVAAPTHPLMFAAVTADPSGLGTELGKPWPHALWVAAPDADRPGGPYRMPALLRYPPETDTAWITAAYRLSSEGTPTDWPAVEP